MTVDHGAHGTDGRVPEDPGADLVAHARLLHQVYDAVLSDDVSRLQPRSLVSASWQRSLAARVDPERLRPPIRVSPADLPDVRAAHPLNDVLPLLRSTLVSIADEAMHIMIITDADGVILWREGASALLHPADDVGLCAGTRWAEDAAGTNAMGTTLAVDAPVQIHSAEHLVRTLHAWTCAAAPVHDPDTGAILGAIDISGPLHTVHPAMVQLVSATAQLAENQLRVHRAAAHGAPGDDAAGRGHRPARGEPAAGTDGHRRRAVASTQHAAPGQPARPSRRAGHPERTDRGGGAVRLVARAGGAGRGCRPGAP